MAATMTEEITEFALLAAEAAGRVMVLESASTSDPALDAAVVLFETVVQVVLSGAAPPGILRDCLER
jgi:hypothetical protein